MQIAKVKDILERRPKAIRDTKLVEILFKYAVSLNEVCYLAHFTVFSTSLQNIDTPRLVEYLKTGLIGLASDPHCSSSACFTCTALVSLSNTFHIPFMHAFLLADNFSMFKNYSYDDIELFANQNVDWGIIRENGPETKKAAKILLNDTTGHVSPNGMHILTQSLPDRSLFILYSFQHFSVVLYHDKIAYEMVCVVDGLVYFFFLQNSLSQNEEHVGDFFEMYPSLNSHKCTLLCVSVLSPSQLPSAHLFASIFSCATTWITDIATIATAKEIQRLWGALQLLIVVVLKAIVMSVVTRWLRA
jgi:hypothetical protein